MRTLNKSNIPILLIACYFTLFLVPNALSITSEVFPDHISVNSLYHGSKIIITGETDTNKEIIIKISSPEGKTHLRKKGKIGGILWMNTGELEFSPVSDVYLLYSNQEINKILSKNEQETYAIGYDAFKRLVNVNFVTNDAEKDKWIKEFIKFKEKNHVYGEFLGKIKVVPKGDKKSYNLTVDWPYKAPPQKYSVIAYSVKDKAIQEKAESTFIVEKVGVLKFLSNMAFNNASAYGIVSIIIAIGAGFLVGLIFKKGSAGH